MKLDVKEDFCPVKALKEDYIWSRSCQVRRVQVRLDDF